MGKRFTTNKAKIRIAFPSGLNWEVETLPDGKITTDVPKFIAWLREQADFAEKMNKPRGKKA